LTLSQFLSLCRRRHNAESDSYFSDDEIYQLLTVRCNEAISYLGLLEDTTTDTSVADQEAYAFPTDAVEISSILYDSERLKRITFRQWDKYRSKSSDTPRITIYYYKEHPYIDNTSQTTIDIPSVLHGHLAPGVISDMYAKDLNGQMASFYENQWLNVSIPAFQMYVANRDTASGFDIAGDADRSYTGEGVP